MGKYSHHLPHLTAPHPYLTEGGLETTLLYTHRIPLPHFASFPLLFTPQGRHAIREAYLPYLRLAHHHRTGIVIETPTWRANAPWVARMGLPAAEVARANRLGVELFQELRSEFEVAGTTSVVIGGAVGPLGDAYRLDGRGGRDGEGRRSRREGVIESYRAQVEALAEAGADLISVMTITDTDEAVAAVLLAREVGLPVWVSFTVETDGKLMDGRTGEEFMRDVDGATDGYASYFGINCAHPKHFLGALRELPPEARAKIQEVRVNASEKSHAELDESEELDRGDPQALGEFHREIRELLPNLCVVGGCCGTDEEHVGEMAKALLQ